MRRLGGMAWRETHTRWQRRAACGGKGVLEAIPRVWALRLCGRSQILVARSQRLRGAADRLARMLLHMTDGGGME